MFGLFDAIIFNGCDFGDLNYENVMAVTYHELGHTVDFSYDITNDKNFITFYKSLDEDLIRATISDYATTSIREFFAECFMFIMLKIKNNNIINNVYKIFNYIINKKNK